MRTKKSSFFTRLSFFSLFSFNHFVVWMDWSQILIQYSSQIVLKCIKFWRIHISNSAWSPSPKSRNPKLFLFVLTQFSTDSLQTQPTYSPHLCSHRIKRSDPNTQNWRSSFFDLPYPWAPAPWGGNIFTILFHFVSFSMSFHPISERK